MAVFTLATKYRPKTFSDVVAQESIKKILETQIQTRTFKNAYLFTGQAGTGKTTCARIFASEINNHNGIPIEIDGASTNGVDAVRELSENARQSSLNSEYRVYIIDEAHMITVAGWNAMLKLIEEPPANTVFIFCTTDVQKIPATILSRVQRYDFTRIGNIEIEKRLQYICEQEGVVIDTEVLRYITRLANGGLRSAITMLDKVLSSTDKSLQCAVNVLGGVSTDKVFLLADKLACRALDFFTVIEEAEQSGADLVVFAAELYQLIVEIIKYRIVGTFDCIKIPDLPQNRSIMKDFDFSDLQSLLSVLLDILPQLKYSSDPKYILEGSLLKWILERR